MYIIHRPEISEGFRGGSEVSGFQGQTTKLQNRSRSALAAFGSFVDCPPLPPQYPPITPRAPGAVSSLHPTSLPTKNTPQYPPNTPQYPPERWCPYPPVTGFLVKQKAPGLRRGLLL